MPAQPPANPLPNDARHQAVLDDLIAMAHDLARAIHRRAMADATATAEATSKAATAALPPAPAPEAADHTPDPTIAFDRIARTVRRTVALSRHIAAPATATVATPAQAPQPKSAAPRTTARVQLIRGVEDAIHRKRRELDTEPLYAELAERLDDPELDGDLQNRPIDDVIEEICRDLGVAQQGRSWVWRRRTPQDIANLRQRAATPPRVRRISEAPSAKQPPAPAPKAPKPSAAMVPIPDHPPPDLAALLALATRLAGDG